jgi:flagellar basal body rod protein FlgB
MALFNFIDRVSSAGTLKDALDQSAIRHRQIADRVANATLTNRDGFVLPAGQTAQSAVGGERGPVDSEQEMAALANEQLYFETAATRLKSTYDSIRRAIRDR